MNPNYSGTALAVIAVLGFSLSLSLLTTAEEFLPKDLTAGEWAGIRGAHAAWRHRFAEGDDGTCSATNPGQQWRTHFDGRGFLAEPFDSTGQTWQWGLELRSYGVGSARNAVDGKAKVTASGQRLSYRWDETLEEWFVNDGRGLEQGWMLKERPTGADDERLLLDLAVRGNLRPVVDAGGRSVSFVSESGTTPLNYGGLKAWDATGRALPARFLARAGGIAVEVDERGATYPVTIDPLAQQAYLKASNPDFDDQFGYSVAISGDTVVVGAWSEDSSTMGVDSTPNEGAANSGAAYVFTRSAGIWSQEAFLKAGNTGANDEFGRSVAISDDTVVVGAWAEDSDTTGVNSAPNEGAADSGAAYVFTRSAGTWSQQAYLKASNTQLSDEFGRSVAISGDTAVIGAAREDSNTTGVNSVPNELASDSGAGYVFTRTGITWSQQAYLKAGNTGDGDFFGDSVAISEDTVIIGARDEDSDATGVNNPPNELAADSGAAYVFTRSGILWSQQAYLKASNTGGDDRFGSAVGVSGDTVVVGAFREDSSTMGVNTVSDEIAPDSGSAYVFTRSGITWSEQAYFKASNAEDGDNFGRAVAVSGEIVVVGSWLEDSGSVGVNSAPDELEPFSGAAYVFTRSGAIWTEEAYLKASNPGTGDYFGRSVAVSGDTVVVGAFSESSGTMGVDSTPDELKPGAGAAYIFSGLSSPPPPSTPPTLKLKGKKRITTSRSRYTLKGTSADADSDLVRVEARDSRPRGAKKFRPAKGTTNWKYKASLNPGRNSVMLRAVDAAGNLSAISRAKIIRK